MERRTFELVAAGLLACSMAVCGGGCALETVPPVPTSLAEYNKLEQTHPQAYTRRTIVLRQLERVLDRDLSMAQRIASLELLADPRLKDVEQSNVQHLRLLESEADAPDELVLLAREVLVGRGLASRTSFPVRSKVNPPKPPAPKPPPPKPPGPGPKPPGPKPPPPKPPGPGPKPPGPKPPAPRPTDLAALADWVKGWARDRSGSLETETRYRQQLLEITGKTWEVALVDLINTPGFLARGSALELLNQRFSRKQLSTIISSVTDPRTDAMVALGMFCRRLGYIPANGTEFLATAMLYKTRKRTIRHAARYSDKWNTDYEYEFNIRDFHLLTRLALDPLQEDLRRTDLILRLGKAFLHRPHVAARSGAHGARINDRFEQQVEKLKMPDLWNLLLVNGMLEREQMQMALRVTAIGDRQDRRHAWGGLVFYANGRAEARRYPSATVLEGRANDLIYVPATIEVRYAYDALCRFHCHFEKVENAKRAGPSAEELRQAKEDNIYGLVLTSISKDVFCAHYYSAQGVVVSLGMFPFRQ